MTATDLSRGATAVLHRMLAAPVHGNTLLSPAGVWLVLATAATGAVGAARRELTAVTGEVDVAGVDAAVRGLQDTGAAAALGAWTGPDGQVRPSWAQQWSRLSSGPIPATPDLDRWAATATDGLIDTFPVQPTADTVLLLASALAARSAWADPFTDHNGLLHRTVRRAASPVLRSESGRTVVAVLPTQDGALEVLLAVGRRGTTPAQVLTDAAGDLIDVPAGGERRLPGWVDRTPSPFPGTAIDLRAFDLTHRLDLTTDPARYGLAALTDRAATDNQLAGLLSGSAPVLLTDAVSVARMQFDAKGFAAGSVSALAFMRSMAPKPKDVCVRLDLRHQEFGVLVRTVRDRAPLFAGWIVPAG